MVKVAHLNIYTPTSQILHDISFETGANLAILGVVGVGKYAL